LADDALAQLTPSAPVCELSRAMREFDRRLQVSLTAFVSDIEVLLRRAAVGALEAALGEHAVAPIGRTIAARGEPARRPGARPVRPVTRRKKRSPENLARLTGALDAYIRKHKGLGVEAIGKAMGVSTRELALPMKKLLSERRIAARGRKRATRYFPR
jgi:hypothetical protein